MPFDTEQKGPADDLEELFDLDLKVVPAATPVTGATTGTFSLCGGWTCSYSCNLTCTGATGNPCAC